MRSPSGLLAVALTASVLVPAAARADGCSTAIRNSNCTIEIERVRPVTPVPIRAEPGALVTVRVKRGPLEKIQFTLTLADTPAPDPLGTIFKALSTPLGSFVDSVSAKTNMLTPQSVPKTANVPEFQPPPPPPPSPSEQALNQILQAQVQLTTDVRALDADLERLGDAIDKVRAWPAGTWQPAALSSFREKVTCAVSQPPDTVCDPADPAWPKGGLGTRALPSGQLDVLDERLAGVAKLLAQGASAPRVVTEKMNLATTQQARLRAKTNAIGAAQAALTDVVKVLDAAVKVGPTVQQTYGGFPDGTNRSATIKLATKDLFSKESEDLAAVTIQWGGTGWEMSGGLLFSALPARAFANAPVIVGGVPQTVEGGGVKTLLVETQTRPMLVPFVFAHYRYGEWAWNGQRIALLSTFGVGVNTYSASADFAATPLSFAFRGLIVSPVLHFVRDLRLTNGLYPGLELGSSPPAPSTERHWVRKLAVGVSYVIPD